ncbi:MAG: hypothetical protein KA604_01485 [Candidatus Saccharimonas sp.]|nr:hypothetical protein [Candidatus Saccharimonas sp.]
MGGLSLMRKYLLILVVIAVSISSLGIQQAHASQYHYFYEDTTISTKDDCTKASGEWVTIVGTPPKEYCRISSTPMLEVSTIMDAGWLASCMKQRIDNKGWSSSEIAEYDMTPKMAYNDAMAYGFAGNGDDDGISDCTNGSAQKIFTDLGFSDFLQVLDFLDCEKTDGGSGRNCENKNYNSTEILEKILSRKFNHPTPEMGSEAKYWFFYDTALTACNLSKVDNPTSAQRNDALSTEDTSHHVMLKEYDTSSKSMVDVVYAITDGLDKGRRIDPTMSNALYSYFGADSSVSEMTCGELAKKTLDPTLSSSFLAWAKNHEAILKKVNDQLSNSQTTQGKSTCAVGGIGWIICPVMNFLSSLMDRIMEFLGEHFLKTDPELFQANDKNGTYVAWKIFRNYANIAFILVFLIIIFSQISSVGISNYGLKRMLPRLIIAAILVNISYFICQAAVDLSNFIGFATSSLFDGIVSQVNNAAPGGTTDTGSWESTIGSVLLVGAGLALALALGILVPALLAALMIIVILLVRKALIVLLIVISPLAFVAYLLPNTEQWFKKWYSMLLKLLMVFPIIAAVFGGSKLASAVINAAGASTINGTTGEDDAKWSLQLIALGVTVVPFFVVPGLLKGAVAASGALGAKLQGWGNKATGRVGAKSKEGYIGRNLAERKKITAARNAQIAGGTYKGRGGVFNPRNLRSAASGRLNRSAITGKAGDRIANMGEALEDQEFNEQVKAASVGISQQSSGDVLKSYQSGGMTEAQKAAAIEHIMSKGSFGERKALVESVDKNMSRALRKRISDGVYAKGDQNIFGSGIGADIAAGSIGGESGLRQKTLESINGGHVNGEHLVQGERSTQYLADVALGEKTEKDIDPITGKQRVDPITGIGLVKRTSLGPTSAAHTAAQGFLASARTEAQRNTGTKAKAAGAAMDTELKRF